jgi:hypothetical protein
MIATFGYITKLTQKNITCNFHAQNSNKICDWLGNYEIPNMWIVKTYSYVLVVLSNTSKCSGRSRVWRYIESVKDHHVWELVVGQGVVGFVNLGFQVWMFELCMAYILGIHLATFQVLDNLVYYGFI